MHLRVEDRGQLFEWLLSLLWVLKIKLRLGIKHLYPLSHLSRALKLFSAFFFLSRGCGGETDECEKIGSYLVSATALRR